MPPDLTRVAMRNNGALPAERLRRMIDGRGRAAHGAGDACVVRRVQRREALSKVQVRERFEALIGT